jgi:subtilisin family serine protease
VVLAASLALVTGAAVATSPPGETVPGNLTTTGAGDEVDVVVTFESAAARDPAVVRRVGGAVTGGTDVSVVPVLFATVPEAALDRLRAAPGVASVEPDRQVQLIGVESGRESGPPSTEAPARLTTESGLRPETAGAAVATDGETSWAYERIRAGAAAEAVPESEQAAVDVAVLDTGVDTDHPQLADSLAWGIDTTGEEVAYGLDAVEDTQGHGTLTTGLIAAAADGSGTVGVAPGVDVYAVQVLEGRYGELSDIVQGVDAVLAGPDGEVGTEDDPDVISMSLGGELDTEAERRAIENASEVALVVAAAGNTGDGSAETNDVAYPAAYEPVVAVAATNRQGVSPDFSSEGAEVEVAAPGVDVPSTAVGGGTENVTGTSFSAPLVSGAAALVVAEDLADGSRDHSNDAVRKRLQTATQDLGPDGRDPFTGFGEIRVDAAVAGEPAETELDVALTAPGDGETVEGTVAVRAAVTDDDGDRPTVEIAVGDGPWRSMSYDTDQGTYRYPWEAGGRFAGEYTLRVRAREDGVTVRDTVTVVVDGGDPSPSVRIDSPTEGERIEGEVQVVVEAADGQTPATELTVEVAVGDGPWRPASYSGSEFVADLTVDGEPGEATLRARATDGDGRTTTVTRPVVVDEDDPPRVTVYSPAPGERVVGSTLLIAQPVDDRTPTANHTVEYRVDGGSWRSMEYNPAYDDFDANLTVYGLADGSHEVQFRADDGTDDTTETVGFEVDNDALSAPGLAVEATGAAVEPGKRATVSATVELATNVSSLETYVTGLPANWTVTDVDRDGGLWFSRPSVLAWSDEDDLTAGRTLTPSLTVEIPETASTSANVTFVVVTGDGRAEGVGVTVGPGGDPVIDSLVGEDGVQFEEVLEAIRYYNTDAVVPGTDGERVSFEQILEIIRRYNEQN